MGALWILECYPQSGDFVAQRDEKWSTLLAVLPKIVGLVGGSASRRASFHRVRRPAVHGTVRGLAAVCGLAAAAVLASACSGDDAEPSDLPPLTATTGSASPSPSATAAPSPPAKAREKSSKGAAAFVRFYIGLINDAYRTGDSQPLRTYAAPSCDSCTSIAAAVDDIYKDGGHAQGGQLTIRELMPSGIGEDDTGTVVVEGETSRLREVNDSGAVTAEIDGRRGTLFFDLRFDESLWTVRGIRQRDGA
jgi:Family of unknown function (DUF6318)